MGAAEKVCPTESNFTGRVRLDYSAIRFNSAEFRTCFEFYNSIYISSFDKYQGRCEIHPSIRLSPLLLMTRWEYKYSNDVVLFMSIVLVNTTRPWCPFAYEGLIYTVIELKNSILYSSPPPTSLLASLLLLLLVLLGDVFVRPLTYLGHR